MTAGAKSVAHLSTAHVANDTRIFHKELRSLAAAGYDATYFVHHETDERRDGVDIRSIGTADSRVERWRGLRRIYADAKAHDADLYHVHDFELLPVALALKRRTDACVVYDAHEDYGHIVSSRDWIPGPLKPVLATTVPTFETQCAKRFDGVVAATEWITDSLSDRGVSNVRTVHNFPLTESIEFRDPGVSPTSEYTLGYAGGLTDVKGLTAMLELLRELRERGNDVSLWMLGPFPGEETERRARSFVETHGLDDDVRFFGYVDYQNVFGYLRETDIGLALLDREHYEGGIPTKLFEYMYSELPVVVTEIDATERYFSTEWGRIVPESDPDAQATAVEELLSEPQLRERMGTAGRAAVEAEYCWEREEKQLLDLYDELL